VPAVALDTPQRAQEGNARRRRMLKTLVLVAASLNLSVSYRTRYWVTVGPCGADA
jgi:hypothetical protein